MADDSIQCFDLEMVQSEAQDDLRMSIGAAAIGNNLTPPEEAKLITQLEKSREEYDNLKKQKDLVEREKQEEQLQNSIEMRETIEVLKEESLQKNE